MYIHFFENIQSIYKHQKKIGTIINSLFNSPPTFQKEILTKLPQGKPEYFDYIPKTIKKHILDNQNSWTFEKYVLPAIPNIPEVTLYFVYDASDMTSDSMKINILLIRSWFLFLSPFVKTNKKFQFYFYLTHFKKKWSPELTEFHINTGFTMVGQEYVYIYREEEWFKVFIHETMHAFQIETDPKINNHKICTKYLTKKRKQHLCTHQYKHFEGIAEYHAIMFYNIYYSIFTDTDILYNLGKEYSHAKHMIRKNEKNNDIRIYEYVMERLQRFKQLNISEKSTKIDSTSLKGSAIGRFEESK